MQWPESSMDGDTPGPEGLGFDYFLQDIAKPQGVDSLVVWPYTKHQSISSSLMCCGRNIYLNIEPYVL